MATPNELKWSTLTRAINEMKNPAAFLRNKIFSRDRLFPTTTIELSYWLRGRKMAPFVRRGRGAIMVEGPAERFTTVSLPHIRIKRPMTPSQLLDHRRPGSPIFVQQSDMSTAIAQYLAIETKILDDDISNTEEWLASQALRGTITYSSLEDESFTVTIPRSASHTVTLTGTDLWTASTSRPAGDFSTANELVNDDTGLTVGLAIMGTAAADAFVQNANVLALLDNRRVNSGGDLDLTQQLQESGALYLGTFYGMEAWRYGRKLELPDGTMYDLIRPEYVEFVATSPRNEFYMAYGPINDMKAFGDSTPRMARRFSKSWETEDPSVRWHLAESNPLPVPARPDSTVSMKVV